MLNPSLLFSNFSRWRERARTVLIARCAVSTRPSEDRRSNVILAGRIDVAVTKTRSATAGKSERELQWPCFHKVK
jgi:hypothetical protein